VGRAGAGPRAGACGGARGGGRERAPARRESLLRDEALARAAVDAAKQAGASYVDVRLGSCGASS
jgi:hypothetical protein